MAVVDYTVPGVHLVEPPPVVPHLVTPASTSWTAFVGSFAQGTPGQAVLVSSWRDFDDQFGGVADGGLAAYAVWQFFQNGGGNAWIVPLAPGVAPSTTTLGPLTLTAHGRGTWATGLTVALEAPPAPPGQAVPPAALDFVVRDKATSTVLERLPGVPSTAKAGAPQTLAGTISSSSSYFTAAVTTPGAAADVAAVAAEDVTAPPTVTWTAATFSKAVLDQLGGGADSPALDSIAPLHFNLMCIPELVWLAQSDQLSVIEAATKYCLANQAFFIADPPPPVTGTVAPAWADPTKYVPMGPLGSGATGAATFISRMQPAMTTATAIAGALYYPWLQIADPAGGPDRLVPPSGTVAGVYARTDASRGVWKAPAGSEASLAGVMKLADTIGDDVNGYLNQAGINCLRNFHVVGNVVWGARTMAGADLLGSGWKYVPVRRLTDFIEQSLMQSLRWAVFEPNGEPLWASLRLEAGQFMAGLMALGAFTGATAAEAYRVACDATTTTEQDILSGIVNLEIGFQASQPAEFVVLTVQLYAGGLPAAS